MAKLNIAFVAALLLLLLITTPAQADQAKQTDQDTLPAPPPAQLNNQSCFDLLDVKNKNEDCPSDVLKFIGAIPRIGCGSYCHVSRDCCNATVALDTYHPECWKYLMNNNASENDRYMLVMTCAKSLPPF
jgi:hypothetical protein